MIFIGGGGKSLAPSCHDGHLHVFHACLSSCKNLETPTQGREGPALEPSSEGVNTSSTLKATSH